MISMSITAIKLRNSYQICYIEPKDIPVKICSHYIVETAYGVDIGRAFRCPKLGKDNNELKGKLIREACSKDMSILPDIEAIEKNAFNVCLERVQKRQLEMKLVLVKCLFDKTKIIFYFVADNRVDFRDLVKDLAAVFRTRIEMRQIGVRDETRLIGGFGSCGRPLCCGYLNEGFDPVSIKMAKEQNLNLNSQKISGMCGRLLCCLGYEYDTYLEMNKELPSVGTKINVGDIVYTVIMVDTLNEMIEMKNGGHNLVFSIQDFQRDGDKFIINSKAIEKINKLYSNDEQSKENDFFYNFP